VPHSDVSDRDADSATTSPGHALLPSYLDYNLLYRLPD